MHVGLHVLKPKLYESTIQLKYKIDNKLYDDKTSEAIIVNELRIRTALCEYYNNNTYTII